MATSNVYGIVESLGRSVFLHDGDGLTDGQLLGRFVELDDEASLAILVRRHGPLVWSICRRVLGDHHDAEDAFQATFLVLARKAASVKPRERVANWLYGVASLAARKAKATLAKRRTRERQTVQVPETAVTTMERDDYLHDLLHEEVDRLPDKYRISIILCYLEEQTCKEAARQLGVPEGTLAAWLARGRSMLAKRLARHGLVLSATALTAALAQSMASAVVPAALTATTLKATSLLVAEQVVSGVVSTRVIDLMEGVIKGMWATKLKMTAAALLTVIAAVGVGSGGLAYRMQPDERETASETIQPYERQDDDKNARVRSGKEGNKGVKIVDDDADKNPLVGSGKEGKKEVKIADFDSLDVHMPIHVSAKQADAFSVVISGDDNLLDLVKTAKDGSTLKISSARRSWRTSRPLKVTITMPALKQVRQDSASQLTIQDFKSSKDFNVKTTGASKLDGSIEASNVKLDASGASKVTLKFSGSVKDFNAQIAGASKLDGSVEAGNMKLSASGASKVTLKGSAKKAALSASGASRFQLEDFALESANVELSGASSAAVNAKTSLDYSLSGASTLHYPGNPKVGKARSSGASSVRHERKP